MEIVSKELKINKQPNLHSNIYESKLIRKKSNFQSSKKIIQT